MESCAVMKQHNAFIEHSAPFVLYSGPKVSQCFTVLQCVDGLNSEKEFNNQNILSAPEHSAYTLLCWQLYFEFFTFEDYECLYSIDCCFDYWVIWQTQDSSPAAIFFKTSSPSSLNHLRSVKALSSRFGLWTSVSIFGTQQEHNLWWFKQSVTISCKTVLKFVETHN